MPVYCQQSNNGVLQPVQTILTQINKTDIALADWKLQAHLDNGWVFIRTGPKSFTLTKTRGELGVCVRNFWRD